MQAYATDSREKWLSMLSFDICVQEKTNVKCELPLFRFGLVEY